MADFTTLGAHFTVRVNDGFKWALYHMTAPSEADAHASARTMWAADQGKTRIQDEPMPDTIPPDIAPEQRDEYAEMKADLSAATDELGRVRQELEQAKTESARKDAEINDLKMQLNQAPSAPPAPPLETPPDGTVQSTFTSGGPIVSSETATTSGFTG